MSTLNEKMLKREQLIRDGVSAAEKFKEVQYQLKVATVERNQKSMSRLNAEAQVLTDMVQDFTRELANLDSSIKKDKEELKSESLKFSILSLSFFTISIAGFYMTFEYGSVWFSLFVLFGCMSYVTSKSKKELSSGLSSKQIKDIKKKANEEYDSETRKREELAESIARNLRK